MPWSGGVFTRNNGAFTGTTVWAQDAAAGTKITSAHHDTHDQDLAGGINNCLTKDGTNAATANLNVGGHKITNMAVGTVTADAARYGQTITAMSIDPMTNILTATRADGDVTVDLTPIVVGASYGSLANKTTAQTITGNWEFDTFITITSDSGIEADQYISFSKIGMSVAKLGYDPSNNWFALKDNFGLYPLRIVMANQSDLYVYNRKVWTEGNFTPADYSPTTHSHYLGDLYDVTVSHPVDGDVLQFNSGANVWQSTSLASISGVIRSVTGTAPVSVTGTTDVTVSVPVATTSVAGLLSAADKTKLDALSTTFVGTVFGRSGTVTAMTNDYTIQQIGNLYFQAGAPSTTGVPQNSIWFGTLAGSGVHILRAGAWVTIAS